MRVKVRGADEQDTPALGSLLVEINNLHSEALPHVFARLEANGSTDAFVRERLGAGDGQILVAEDTEAEAASQVIGFVWVRLHEVPSTLLKAPCRYAEVDTLVVTERARRHGVGRALVERAHEWAADQGVTEVQVVVWEFNAAAIDLYERVGYATVRRTMRRTVVASDLNNEADRSATG